MSYSDQAPSYPLIEPYPVPQQPQRRRNPHPRVRLPPGQGPNHPRLRGRNDVCHLNPFIHRREKDKPTDVE